MPRVPAAPGRRSLLPSALLPLALVVAIPGPAAVLSAQDLEGSRDHPMISRFRGSTIVQFERAEFDEYMLVRGPVAGSYLSDSGTRVYTDAPLGPTNGLALEGRVWQITYEAPEGRSTLEIIRNYERELEQAGFEILFRCAGTACAGPPESGRVDRRHVNALSVLLMERVGYKVGHLIADFWTEQHFVSARLRRSEGDVYASILAAPFRSPMIRLDVVEVAPMETGAVTIDADAMADALERDGRVALYGIDFDTDRADLRPESAAVLAEIASVLGRRPDLRLLVVGHTDDEGGLDYNLELSQRRAAAVVRALGSEFGVSADRLRPIGVGPAAPLARNDTVEGRALNRRVELIEWGR